jgi:hypothetical protein
MEVLAVAVSEYRGSRRIGAPRVEVSQKVGENVKRLALRGCTHRMGAIANTAVAAE